VKRASFVRFAGAALVFVATALEAQPARDDRVVLASELTVNIEASLPPDLRGPSTTLTKVSAGLSGAAVYRVDSGERTVVLKLTGANVAVEQWRNTLHILQMASSAGLAPRIIHVDEDRRAIVSEFVIDRSFPMFYRDPRTHAAAVTSLGRMLRRVHEIPLPPNAIPKDARTFLRETWSSLEQSVVAPAFVADAVTRLLDEEPPAAGRDVVLSHNDVNPTNLVYDGANLLLLDWDTAGPNEPFYDLAAIALFLRMDETTCRTLLAAHDDEPTSGVPARFAYDRRLAGVLCCAVFLRLAHAKGHPGASGGETLESTPTLGEVYQRLMAGAVNLTSAEGQWAFGLALLKAGMLPR
jgi:aminoglycoside phosphotransferase (APT) family kinase protein